MTDEELLASIAEHVGDDKAKAKQFALDMLGKDETKAVAQVLVQRGLSKRTADVTGKAGELEEKVRALTEKLEEQAEELETLRQKEPNFARQLADTETRWKNKVTAAETRAEQEAQRRRDASLERERQRFLNYVDLGKPGGVEEEWGEVYIPGKYYSQIQLDENEKLKVLEPGTDTPYDPADGDPLKQLAEDAKRAVPSKYRLMGKTEGGGGAQPAGGPARPKTSEQVQESLKQKVGYATP